MEYKRIGYVTPKGYLKLKECIDSNPDRFKDMEICVTDYIYLNTIDPTWSEEKCDDICYIVSNVYSTPNGPDVKVKEE